MPLLPVALYGLEVPAGDIIVPAVPDFPATFRITMAAIDPSEEPEVDENSNSSRPRATLKIIRQPMQSEEDDEYMRAMLADSDSDSNSDSEGSSEDESEEEVNGGPSDPAKSKKAKKEAAVKDLLEALKNEDSDDEMEEAGGVNGANGTSIVKKGKAKATDKDEEDSEEEDSDDEDLEVEEFVLCTLDPDKNYQQPLDITIAEDERVFFKVTGTHTIYLTGNYVIPDDDGHNHHHEVYDSDSDSEGSEVDLSPDEDEIEFDMDDESDELDDLEDPRITEVDSDDEEPPKLVKATEKKSEEKKGKNKRTAAELEDATTLDDLISKSSKPDPAEEPKLSKKQLKKLKKNNGEAAAVKAEEQKNGLTKDTTPAKSDKSDKKVQFAKNLEQGPTGSAEKSKPTESALGNGAKLGVKKVQGVTIDDKKLGKGPNAKKGNTVSMRYIGKLLDGQVFDANKSGKPFSFKLGQGSVIKGWDIGIEGMAVGGERRLTIPSNLAYGNRKDPKIPANSTLVFDVKLLEIK